MNKKKLFKNKKGITVSLLSTYSTCDFIFHMFEYESLLLWDQLHLDGVQLTKLLVTVAQDVGGPLPPDTDTQRLQVRQVTQRWLRELCKRKWGH